MKKQLIIIIVACLIVSLAEILFINLSPQIGVLDENNDVESSFVLSKESRAQLSPIYEHRPHKNDFTFYKPMYKIIIMGSETMFALLDIGGLVYSRSPNQNDLCTEILGYENTNEDLFLKCLPHIRTGSTTIGRLPSDPGVFSSLLYEFFDLDGAVSYSSEQPTTYGDAIAAMNYGWWSLVDFVGGSSVLHFEDSPLPFCLEKEDLVCIKNVNMSLQQRRENYADYFDTQNKADTFLKTFLDETDEKFEGISYLSYFPHYKGVFIVTTNVPDEELEDSTILINETEYSFDLVYPLIFVNEANLSPGEYNLEIKTSKSEYQAAFKVGYRELVVRDYMLNDDGLVINIQNLKEEKIILSGIQLANDDALCIYTNSTQYDIFTNGLVLLPQMDEGSFVEMAEEYTFVTGSTDIKLRCTGLDKLARNKKNFFETTAKYTLESGEEREITGSAFIEYESFGFISSVK
ncbi:MAG: hypothetical protein GY861_27775 [bacterium]|nr:hypothetical protein [bacterium]